jgi:hypothetical protein
MLSRPFILSGKSAQEFLALVNNPPPANPRVKAFVKEGLRMVREMKRRGRVIINSGKAK